MHMRHVPLWISYHNCHQPTDHTKACVDQKARLSSSIRTPPFSLATISTMIDRVLSRNYNSNNDLCCCLRTRWISSDSQTARLALSQAVSQSNPDSKAEHDLPEQTSLQEHKMVLWSEIRLQRYLRKHFFHWRQRSHARF